MQMLVDQLEQSRFVADATVGNKHHLLEIPLCRSRLQSIAQGSGHFGSAGGVQRQHKLLRLLQTRRVGSARLVKEFAMEGIKFDDIKAISSIQTRERHLQAVFGLLYGRAAHGPGSVDNKNDFSRQTMGKLLLRRHHHKEGIVVLSNFLNKQGCGWLVSALSAPSQFKIPVHRYLLRLRHDLMVGV